MMQSNNDQCGICALEGLTVQVEGRQQTQEYSEVGSV